MQERVEKALHDAALWGEVKDRLTARRSDFPADSSSVCDRARACRRAGSDFDGRTGVGARPIATQKIEELVVELKKQYTIVIVTHNMQQAARVSDKTAFFMLGQTGRIQRDAENVYESGRKIDGRLHYGRFG
jgi:phosphate transport system ATP-binding protein